MAEGITRGYRNGEEEEEKGDDYEDEGEMDEMKDRWRTMDYFWLVYKREKDRFCGREIENDVEGEENGAEGEKMVADIL